MNQRKRFVTPRVVQVAEVDLEQAILSAQYNMQAHSMGQDLEVFDFAPSDGEENTNAYTVEWD